MRLIKMLGLAALATAALLPAINTGTASASKWDACLSVIFPCPNLAIDPEGTTVLFTAKATNPVFKGSIEEKCNESNLMFTEKGSSATIDSLSFTGSCTPCPTASVSTPISGQLEKVGEEYFLVFPMNVTLNSCFGFTNCKFESGSVSLKLVPGAESKNNELRAEAEKLGGPGGLCGTSAAWTANYVVSTPTVFYWFLLP